MKKYLGRHLLGHEGIKVWADPQLTGAVARTPGHFSDGCTKIGEIIVGLKHPDWPVVYDNLSHEAWEYVMAKKGCRYEPDLAVGHDTSNCIFLMSHVQFQQICSTVSDFLCTVENRLFNLHQGYHQQ